MSVGQIWPVTGSLCGPPSQGAWNSDSGEAERLSSGYGGKGSVESGLLKAEQTYGDLRVTTAGKKRSSGNGSWYY